MSPRLTDLQRDAAKVGQIYAESFGIDRDAAFYLGKLTEELGELTAATLQSTGRARGAEQDPEVLRRNIEDEAADLLGFLLLFADWQGIDLGAAFDRKWGRYLDRDTTREPE